jgi:2'-5' RNA ligase
MSKVRCFIALDLPTQIIDQISSYITLLKKEIPMGVSWVKAENIHITLKFLGDVEDRALPDIEEAIKKTSSDQNSFLFEISNSGAFPNWNKPRILWLGFEYSKEIHELVSSLENNLRPLGFMPEARPFSPHLSIGRIKETIRPNLFPILENILKNQRQINGSFRVEFLRLYKSDLHPEGPTYSILFTSYLKITS